jgi:hypothetical protein
MNYEGIVISLLRKLKDLSFALLLQGATQPMPGFAPVVIQKLFCYFWGE